MANSGAGTSEFSYEMPYLRSLIWQEDRMDLLLDVLAHPQHLPSIPELLFTNQDRTESTVLFQLSMLVEHDILTRVTHEDSDERRVYYTLTDEGWDVLSTLGTPFTAETVDTLQDVYQAVEKPDSVTAAETAPRPEVNPAGLH